MIRLVALGVVIAAAAASVVSGAVPTDCGQLSPCAEPVDWVTIEASPADVVYGDGVRLSGRIYVPPPAYVGGPPLPPPSLWFTVVGHPAVGKNVVKRVAATNPFDSGSVEFPLYAAWGATLTPGAGTTYVAEWLGYRSLPVEIAVRPRVTLRRVGRRLAIAVQPAKFFAGRDVVLQRRGVDGFWHGVKRIGLDTKGTAAVATRSYGALRVYVRPRLGYMDGWSEPLKA